MVDWVVTDDMAMPDVYVEVHNVYMGGRSMVMSTTKGVLDHGVQPKKRIGHC